ncbi:amidohydrolase [Aestuariivirga litoralis]|nr:amidohydrolase [Aestuariivirga litoralis]
MCRACVSPVLNHPSLFESPVAFTPLGAVTPNRRGFMALSTAALLGAGLPAVGGGSARAATSDGSIDTIFKGGNIIPIVGPASAEAIAVSGGKIVKLGAASDIMSMATAKTQVIDLQGRTLLPGLIDPHNHTVLSSIYLELLTDVGYLKNKTREDLIANLKLLVSITPEGSWVLASNFDNLLQGGDLSRDELDKISSTTPIFVWYTNGHDACVNSPALKAAGITEDIGELPGGGHFGRGPDGKLNGLVYEEAALLKTIKPGLPTITPAIAISAVNKFVAACAAAGNTLLHEPGTLKADWIAPFMKLAAQAPLRTSASLMYEDMKGYDDYRKYGVGAKATQLPDTLFTLYGVKLIGDGSNQTETGAQTKPYLNSTSSGKPNFDAAAMKEMVANVKAAGLPSLIHCNGDLAIDIALDALEGAYAGSTELGINRIEHATMARQDQIDRMKKLNVEPSFLMNHVTLYGAAYRDQIFGPERANFMDPAGACDKAGLRFTLHTDSPCSPIGPLRLVKTAVTRLCQIDNSVIGADQAVSVQRALEAITIDAARQVGQPDRLGSLEAGKEADFTILEDNPFTVDPAKIDTIKVSETWVAGDKKFG